MLRITVCAPSHACCAMRSTTPGAERTKSALVFDHAGAFPREMAALRDTGIEQGGMD